MACAFVGALALANSAAISTLGRRSPFLLYYPGVAAAGLFGGFGPGVLATLLSALSIFFLNVEPSYTFKAPSPDDVLRLGSFVAFGLLISYLCQTRRTQNQKLRREAGYWQAGERRFRLMVDEIKDYAIFMLDTKGFVQSWNKGAEKIKGYKPEEIIGQHFSKFYPPDDAAKVPAVELELAAEHGRFEAEGWRLRKDGSRFWANVVITALRAPTGKPIGFAKVTRDLTERRAQEEALRASEEALRERAEQLARSNADLERFAYVASHDLQEPLRMVNSFMQLLEQRYRGKLDAEADEFIRFAVDGATRMKQLINDLLAYSRLNRQPRAASAIDCEGVLEEVLENLELAVRKSQAVVTHDHLPTLLADHSQMLQLLQNLIGNSIKFHGPRAPRVHVSARSTGAAWVFSVRDNGIGISPEHHQRIFAVFQRLHDRSQYPGTGIGLAICQRIVERHGGQIWVESQDGEGATFFFSLPATLQARKERELDYSHRSTD